MNINWTLFYKLEDFCFFHDLSLIYRQFPVQMFFKRFSHAAIDYYTLYAEQFEACMYSAMS